MHRGKGAGVAMEMEEGRLWDVQDGRNAGGQMWGEIERHLPGTVKTFT